MVTPAVRYGQSVYSWHGGFDADEFSAMPSVHVGWALIVAIAVITSVAEPVALAWLRPTLWLTLLVRGGDSQSLLAGRNRGRVAGGPGCLVGAVAAAVATFW